MAELAVASGIAGLISLSIQTVKLTCSFTADLASAERTVLDYLLALRSLEAILVQLGSLAETRRLKWLLADRPQALSMDDIKACQHHLTQTQNKLNKSLREDGHLRLRHALCWPLKRKETLESIQALQQYRDTFHAALSVDVLAASVATYEELRSSKEHEIREKILQWLTPYNIQPTIQSICFSRHPDTWQWIFGHETFNQWTSNTGQLLWCHGDPGSGKTILAGTIVEHLSKTNTTLCHFFDHQTPETATPEAVLRNLIKQFASQRLDLHPKISSIYDDAQENAPVNGPTKDGLLEVFESLCSQSTDIFVIIDALDECDKRRQLVQLFFSLTRAGANVLVISRAIPDLESAFTTCSQIHVRASDSDLKAYICHQLHELDEDLEDSLPTDLKARIVEHILSRSCGLFLLCCLIMHDLQSSYNIAQVRDSLYKAPCNLSGMYDKTTNKILAQAEQKSPRAVLALRILSWVTHSVRPFHMNELRHALATGKSDADLNHENLTSPKMILSVCKGFVKTDEQGYCRLMHLTAYDFFRAHSRFTYDQVNLDIASTCLKYLSFKAFAESPCGDQTSLEQRLEEYPFILYAGHFLGHHVKSVEGKLANELILFLQHPILRSSFAQVRYFRTRKDKSLLAQSYARLPTGQSALQVACGLGLIESAKALLKVSKDISAADDQGWTPLHSAASYGWYEIMQQLIECGAEIEKPDNQGWTPLFWAAIKGHVETARLLLKSKASIQVEDKSGWTSVDWTAYKGDERMMRLLRPDFNNVASGMNISHYRELKKRDAVTTKGFRPLFLAVERKSSEAFDAMLDCNSGVGPSQSEEDAKKEKKKMRRRIMAAYIMLTKEDKGYYMEKTNAGANSITFPESFLLRLLNSGIKNDHLDMVKMVLERGVDLSARAYGNINRRSALHIAAFSTDPRIPALLIQFGADPCEVDNDGHYPLDLAAANARSAVIQEYLKARNIETAVKGRSSSALHLIWLNGSLLHPMRSSEDIQLSHRRLSSEDNGLLLGRRKRFDVKFESPSNSLELLRVELARQFIAIGADVNKRDKHGNTPLQFAIRAGTSAVDLLCSVGADLNISNDIGNTPVHTAIQDISSRSVYKVPAFAVKPSATQLLSLGADPNIRNKNGETALHLAAEYHQLSDSKVLIQHGANPNICDRWGRNVLHALVQRGYLPAKDCNELIVFLQYLIMACTPDAAIQRCASWVAKKFEPGGNVYFPFEVALQHKDEVYQVMARELFKRAREVDPVAVEACLQDWALTTGYKTDYLKACRKWESDLGEHKECSTTPETELDKKKEDSRDPLAESTAF